MCGSDGCCSVWRDCPDALGVTERVEGEGFSGLQRGDHIFVSRIGDREDKLESLLAHEFSHWLCDCGQGATVEAIEKKLMNEMLTKQDVIINTRLLSWADGEGD
jgi:hypothetical protein